MLVPSRESEAWEVGFLHDCDPALEEGVFGDAEGLLNGLTVVAIYRQTDDNMQAMAGLLRAEAGYD